MSYFYGMTTRPGPTSRKRSAAERVRRAAVAAIARAIFLPLRARRVDNRIVLAGSPHAGNHAEFSRYLLLAHAEVDVYFLVDSHADYVRATQVTPARVLRSNRLRDLAKVAGARAIVTLGGPAHLRTWIDCRLRPLFIDAWHGVGFKSRVTKAHPSFRRYDAHLVSSPHVRDYYQQHGAAAIVTGYARTDALIRAAADTSNRDRLAQEFGRATADATAIVLFAPTWAISAADGLSDRAVLVNLDALANELNFDVAYRPHGYATAAEVADLRRVRLMSVDRVSSTEQLLGGIDVLVTDWSSIATDFHALGRPVIYLDAEPPGRDLGPLDASDRVGVVATDPAVLSAAVAEAVSDTSGYLARFDAARRRTVARAWGDTLDGLSSSRYFQAIEQLEREREL